MLFSESFVSPSKRRKVNEAKEAELRKKEEILSVYEQAFDQIPIPSRRSTKKRTTVSGSMQKPRKKTSMQEMQQRMRQLEAETARLKQIEEQVIA